MMTEKQLDNPPLRLREYRLVLTGTLPTHRFLQLEAAAEQLANHFHQRPSRLRIYVAGPITAPTPERVEANVERAIAAGYRVWERGHWPFIPHLNIRWGEWATKTGRRFEYEDYLAWDKAWLEQCDALLFLAPSPGADRERQWAVERGMPIFDSTENIPEVPR